MVFIETQSYLKTINALVTDEQHREIQNQLLEQPGLDTPIPGASGMRKMRVALGDHGKRGGFRIWYVHFPQRDTRLLVFALPKNKGSDLTKDMTRLLAEAVRKEFR